MEFIKNDELPNYLKFRMLDDKKIYIPRNTIRNEIRFEAENHLRSKYNPGRYSNTTKINEIFKHQFSFYFNKLNELLPTLYCKDWLVFTLYQYEISGGLAKKFKDHTLNASDYNYWMDNGPLFRQTSDFLCEKFIEHSTELESKMINSGFEAKSFRQDKDKFLKGENSYVKKLTRKVNWAFDNFEAIRTILCENYNVDESKISKKISCGFITYFTTMVPYFLDSFPCVSLVEFIDKYNSELQWPYPIGIKTDKINEK